MRLAVGWMLASVALGGGWSSVALAQTDALAWLQKVSAAASQLSYSGTFVYQNGTRSETSRIVHVATAGNQFEKLEALDGSPREVIRNNDEVQCYLPDRRLLVIEKRSPRQAFPALLPESLAGLSDHYRIFKGAAARVAGRETQIVRIEPRDAWRFGRQFWVDQEKGLLLRAEIQGAQGESLETMSFTEVQIGVPPGIDPMRPGFAVDSGRVRDWEVRRPKLQELPDDAAWQFRAELPGFRLQSAMLRSAGDTREVRHWMFSDGLAAVSVFISAPGNANESADVEVHTLGAISVMKRFVDGHKVVVMGDVPPAAIKHFAKGIGMRAK